MRSEWTPSALRDFSEQVGYIQQDNPQAAEDVAKAILAAERLLLDMPEMARPGRYPGTREWVIKGLPYILWYRIEGDCLQILRLMHTSRQWPDQP